MRWYLFGWRMADKETLSLKLTFVKIPDYRPMWRFIRYTVVNINNSLGGIL